MQLARHHLANTLLGLFLAGCSASPDQVGAQPDRWTAVADQADATVDLPTLRYVGTTREEREDPSQEQRAYWDEFELFNGTARTFELSAQMESKSITIGTRRRGTVDVHVSGLGWVDPEPADGYCGTGGCVKGVLPGQSVTVRTLSWLRQTRVTIPVRRVETRDPFVPPWQDNRPWVELPFVEYDSSLAAPDAKPPALFWGQDPTVK